MPTKKTPDNTTPATPKKAAPKKATSATTKPKAPAKKKQKAEGEVVAVKNDATKSAPKAAKGHKPERKPAISSESEKNQQPESIQPDAVADPIPAVAPAPVSEPAPEPKPALPEQQPQSGPTPGSNVIIVPKGPIIVKDLAGRLGLKTFQIIHHLMEMNVFASLQQTIEEDIAKKLCDKLGFKLEHEHRETAEEKKARELKEREARELKERAEKEKLARAAKPDVPSRPPVITFMGHVDHGKTSLMDAIRQSRVASGEAGGITQHIGAYSVEWNKRLITFLDTPGHEAFTAMRARGAHCTDIVVLVVAADDGLMPQTMEAITHARAAKVPIIVAINKIDLASANLLKVKAQLQENNLAPEEYGGETICCEVSATKKIGIDKLLEMITLQAEIMELKASPKGLAKGRIIEAQMEVGRGPTATVLVQSGTLCHGDSILAGNFYGRVKGLINDLGKNIKEAGPSTPVKILGFDGVPTPGDEFIVMENDREARLTADTRREKERLSKLEAPPRVTLENLFSTIADGQRKVLNVVLRGDVQGSVEAIVASIKKIPSKKVDLEILQAAVGPITESDVMLAKASNAVVIGFNTRTDNSAANAAKREGIQIKLFSIIYELIDQVKDAMAGLLDPELREIKIGQAVVKKVFDLTKFPVAGCLVQSGRIARSARARVIRRGQPIYDGGFLTLKRFQDEVGEVRSGVECGIRLGDFNEYREEDVIECYQLDKFPQQL